MLTPAFRRWWVPPFMNWIPAWVPPNFITLASSACLWVALGLVATRHVWSPVTLGLALAVLSHGYLVYDQVDGMHAKKTGASSALGEFLDHYLDTYHGAILIVALFALFDFAHPTLALVILWSSHLAFAATMLEERERKELVLGALGSLEAVLLFTAFFLSWLSPAARAWWSAPLLGGWPAYAWLVGIGGLGSMFAAGECLWRIGRVPVEFAVFAVSSFALTLWVGSTPLPFAWAAAIVVLFCSDYTGRVIGSHLLGRPAPWPDWPALGFLALAVVAGASYARMSGGALVVWLAFRTSWISVETFLALRSDWRWANATPRLS